MKPPQKTKKRSTQEKKSSPNAHETPHMKDKQIAEIDEVKLEAGKRLIKEFIGRKHWTLYLDIFLIFAISMSYGFVLYSQENLLGQAFIIFAIICCTITSINHYRDMKEDIEVALKDLDFILR